MSSVINHSKSNGDVQWGRGPNGDVLQIISFYVETYNLKNVPKFIRPHTFHLFVSVSGKGSLTKWKTLDQSFHGIIQRLGF